jgi:hypothetical protein
MFCPFDSEHTTGDDYCNTSGRMNKEESDRIHDLCSRIAIEHDQRKFLALVEELNRILSARKGDAQQENEQKSR